MSELDDVRKRMHERKNGKPLTDYHFKKLYNGMIRLMIVIVVLLASAIIVRNDDLESTILNNTILKNTIHQISQLVLDYLPNDQQVNSKIDYHQIKDHYYYNDGNEVISLSEGKVKHIEKKNHYYIVTILDKNNVSIQYGRIKHVVVKKNQNIKKGMSMGSYQNELTLDFTLKGKKIDYETYQGME